jgi:hypothetical protein
MESCSRTTAEGGPVEPAGGIQYTRLMGSVVGGEAVKVKRSACGSIWSRGHIPKRSLVEHLQQPPWSQPLRRPGALSKEGEENRTARWNYNPSVAHVASSSLGPPKLTRRGGETPESYLGRRGDSRRQVSPHSSLSRP